LSQRKTLKYIVFFSFVGVIFSSGVAFAQGKLLSAKSDYITCWKQPCIYVEGSRWSKKNPNGVGISVAMGTQPVVTDDKIKTVLTRDLKKYGMTSIKFFYEQNDVPATSIAFHIRGGMEGFFSISNVREQVASMAKRAANTNPVFQ